MIKSDWIELLAILLVASLCFGLYEVHKKPPLKLEYHIVEPDGFMWKNCDYSGGNTWVTQNLTVKVWGKIYLPLGHKLTLDGRNQTSVLNFIEKMIFYGANVQVKNHNSS